jgi:iron complex outermembrane receptor protein
MGRVGRAPGDLIVAYAFLDAEYTRSNDGLKDNTPYGIPKHRASLWADYTIPEGDFAGFGFGGGMRFVGETFGDDANSFRVSDSTVFDAAFHYDYEALKFALNASNLFDRKYVASCFTSGAGCFYGERLKVLGTVTLTW